MPRCLKTTSAMPEALRVSRLQMGCTDGPLSLPGCGPRLTAEATGNTSQSSALFPGTRCGLVGAIGIEPMTSAMSTQRSYQLSYAPASAPRGDSTAADSG